jgi:hypothetical protein
MFGGTKLRDIAQQVIQGCEKCQKISIIKDSRCQEHRDWDPIAGKLATRLYPFARGIKVKTAVSICGYVYWMGGGFSLQYRTY